MLTPHLFSLCEDQLNVMLNALVWVVMLQMWHQIIFPVRITWPWFARVQRRWMTLCGSARNLLVSTTLNLAQLNPCRCAFHPSARRRWHLRSCVWAHQAGIRASVVMAGHIITADCMVVRTLGRKQGILVHVGMSSWEISNFVITMLNASCSAVIVIIFIVIHCGNISKWRRCNACA